MKYKITAICYDKRGRIISTCTNQRRTHPLQGTYGRRVGQPHRQSLHAELGALLRAKGRPVHRIQVTRFTKDGKPACAKPCPACSLAIKEWGVKEVGYTVSL